MEKVFTDELILRTQAYFLRHHDTRITKETSELYLHSLGSLYLTYSGVKVAGGGCRPPSPLDGVGGSRILPHSELVSASPDLISPHSCKDN